MEMCEKRKTFTLIELLVVIAIIAILAALLLPALSRVKETSKNAGCHNQLKQLGLGFIQYHTDYGYYTVSQLWEFTDGSDAGKVNFWINAIGPYMKHNVILRQNYSKTPKFMVCPSAFVKSSSVLEYGCSYGYNNACFGTRVTAKWLKKVYVPVRTILSGDCWKEYDSEANRKLGRLEFRGEPWKSVAYRHNRKANMLWVDGHVSAETWRLLHSPGVFNFGPLPWQSQSHEPQKNTKKYVKTSPYTYGYSPYR